MKYRLEINTDRKGRKRYYLAKDIRILGNKSKIRKYIGTKKPSEKDIQRLSLEHAYDIETRAILKKVEMSCSISTSLLLDEMRQELEEIRFAYQGVRPLMAQSELDAIEQDLTIRYVHGTTFIEGNTLTMEQTAKLFNYGILPKDKNLREIYEVQNYKKVLKFRRKYSKRVTVDFVKKIHSLVMDNIDLEMAGVFRRSDDIAIAGRDVMLTPHILIEEELGNIIGEYYGNMENKRYPFEEAVLFHYRFERVHPFTDGNGRTGREILNYMLSRSGYPMFVISGKDRERYIDSFGLGDGDDLKGMTEIFTNLYTEQWLERLRRNLREFVKPGR